MHVPWKDSRCILCCRVAPLTKEHIIPAVLHGNLVCPFLCKPCNDQLGEWVDALATADPYVREAVLRLQAAGEKFRPRVLNGMAWTAETTGGPLRAVFTKKHGLDIPIHRDDDGVLTATTEDAEQMLPGMLQAHGASDAEVHAAMALFAAAPNDALVRLSPQISILKSKTTAVRPDLRGQPLDDVVPLKIAYEFMALAIGPLIFEPCFDAIRAALLQHDASIAREHFQVERLVADDQDHVHGLALEEAPEERGGHAIVHIRLFGRPTWRIGFPWLRAGGWRVIVTQDLATGTIAVARPT